MEVIIKGRHIEITDALRRYAEEKVERLSKYLDKVTKVEIELNVDSNPSLANPQTAEVTLHTKGPLIRGRVSTDNMYASIDGVVDKIERQIKKYKGKIYAAHHKQAGLGEFALNHYAPEEEEYEEEPEGRVVKTKRVPMKPMTLEEATLQMELLNHDFFVFANAETNEVNVVYKRKDKDYGLIEPIIGRG